VTVRGRSGFETGTRDPERRAFFDLSKRISALEDGSSGGADEVWIGPDDPGDPKYELWVDTDAVQSVTSWIAVTWQNGWSDLAGWGPVKYRKIGDIVYLRGAATKVAAGAVDQVIFTLPVGYRPPFNQAFGPWSSNIGTAGDRSARISVHVDGTVDVQQAAMAGGWVELNVVQFSVTP
jgi:hypothetical protein